VCTYPVRSLSCGDGGRFSCIWWRRRRVLCSGARWSTHGVPAVLAGVGGGHLVTCHWESGVASNTFGVNQLQASRLERPWVYNDRHGPGASSSVAVKAWESQTHFASVDGQVRVGLREKNGQKERGTTEDQKHRKARSELTQTCLGLLAIRRTLLTGCWSPACAWALGRTVSQGSFRSGGSFGRAKQPKKVVLCALDVETSTTAPLRVL